MFFNREAPRAMVPKKPISKLIFKTGSINDTSGKKESWVRKDLHTRNQHRMFLYPGNFPKQKVCYAF